MMTRKKKQEVEDLSGWLTPAQAAEEMGRLAGYKVYPDDIRQLRRTGRLTQFKKVGERITLYSRQEIRNVRPPKKHHPEPLDADTQAA